MTDFNPEQLRELADDAAQLANEQEERDNLQRCDRFAAAFRSAADQLDSTGGWTIELVVTQMNDTVEYMRSRGRNPDDLDGAIAMWADVIGQKVKSADAAAEEFNRLAALPRQVTIGAYEVIRYATAATDRLRAVIDKAPHDPRCNSGLAGWPGEPNDCDCWKATA